MCIRDSFIDTDASNGFWGWLGMESNLDSKDESHEGFGYEKVISFQKLRNKFL